MKLVLKNSKLVFKNVIETIINYFQSVASKSIVYGGVFNNAGLVQCEFYELTKGSNYKLYFTCDGTFDIGTCYLLSLCKMDGDYSTTGRTVAINTILAWSKDIKNYEQEFAVATDSTADCICICHPKSAYIGNYTCKVVKVG